MSWVHVIITLCCLTLFDMCRGYNVDVGQPRILSGPKDSMFGYTSVFQETKSGIKLVVGAPKATNSFGVRSGVIFTCDVTVSGKNSCEMDPYTSPSKSSIFEADAEMYGSFISLGFNNTPLVCAPHYRDGEYVIGRCAVNNNIEIRPEVGRTGNGYIKTFVLPNRPKTTLYWNGMGQWGMSGDMLQDGSFILGRPGFMRWRGGFIMLQNNKAIFDRNTTEFSIPEYSYIGYSVVVGTFCGHNSECFAIGGPAKDSGIVLVYRYREGRQTFKLRQTIHGDQRWSYFGAALCAADVNNDGLDDLLVGAPLYTDLDEEDGDGNSVHKDEGRVTVFINRQSSKNTNRMRLEEKLTLIGSNTHDARFGTAITNIGDVNNDGYTDVAIGAPYEDEGRGAVYIYHGGGAGLKSKIQQRILGRDVSNTMRSFGWSISKPSDVDRNGFPDFAVGGYQSGEVAILRTRPIVNVRVTLTTLPELIIRNASSCPRQSSSESCFNIRLCFSYTGKNLPNNLRFNYTLVVDTYKQKERKRVKIRSMRQLTDTVFSEITATRRRAMCMNYTAETLKLEKSLDPFTVVRLETRYDLVQMKSSTSDIQPVLDQTGVRKAVKDTAFQLACGPDNICSSDLVLDMKSRVIHKNSDTIREDINTSIVLNVTKSVVLDVTIRNKQEDAFAVVICITWSGPVMFQRIESAKTKPIICDVEYKEETQGTFSTQCEVLFPIETESLVQFQIFFITDDINENYRMSSGDINVSVTAGNNETNPDDNSYNVTVPITIDAQTVIKGISEPDQFHVRMHKPAKPGLDILHKYVIRNNGPSFLPPTNVLVSLPYTDKKLPGRISVMVISEDGPSSPCTSRDTTNVDEEQTTASLWTTTVSEEMVTYLQTLVPSNLLGLTTQGVDIRRMDCETSRCEEFTCALQHLAVRGSTVIDLSIRLPVKLLPTDEEVKEIQYYSTATVLPPEHPSFYQWNVSVSHQVMTRIYPRYPAKISLFIIIGSAAGGVVLFFIVIIILWKCGFFKREKKYKVMEWRESQKKTADENPSSWPDDVLSVAQREIIPPLSTDVL